MPDYGIVSSPTALGLWPSGVQDLGRTLLEHGFGARLGAPLAGEVAPGPYVREKDSVTGYLNGPAIREHALRLATLVEEERVAGRVPIVLGGDCSILIGGLLALRRVGRPGLFYLDGHQDFYDGAGDHSGEVADMTLGIAVGAAHPLLADIDGLSPYVRPAQAISFGYRDEAEIAASGGRTIDGSSVGSIGLARLRSEGFEAGLTGAIAAITKPEGSATWLHFDTDVVDDGLNPAVDYRLPGGLTWREVAAVLRAVRASGCLAGVSVSIFNPRLDRDGRIAMALSDCLVAGLRD